MSLCDAGSCQAEDDDAQEHDCIRVSLVGFFPFRDFPLVGIVRGRGLRVMHVRHERKWAMAGYRNMIL